jgi:flagellar biosynthesis/type III secretory pathway M-ring protein FliF/YscJ
MLESIEYEVVTKGTVEMSFVAGVVLTAMVIFWCVVLYRQYGRKNLRSYYLGLDDSSRKEIVGVLNNMGVESDFLAVKTNTLFFKKMSNEFVDIVSFLKRRNLS